ncbi:MAG: HAMP domain-containing sensor histidine kinase [Prochlorococcaceae cyanobacterium]
MSPPRSLRERLQTTTFLAVLAGYGVLLLLNQGLQVLQRRAAHAQLLEAVRVEVDAGRLRLPAVGPLRLPGGDEVRWVSPRQTTSLRIERLGDQRWLVCAENGLEVRQNITAKLKSERRGQLLLLAVAGFSSLITSALLRPVLRNGLSAPLAVLSQALASAEPDAARPELIAVADQPAELRPIANAFNALQRRLAEGHEEQRTFIDGVAHELRTPLTLISGNAQRLERLLAGTTSDATEAPLLQAGRAIHAEADRMTRLVRDLLDLARQDGDCLELQVLQFDAGDALLAAYERLETLATGRLRLQAPDADADLCVRGDPERLGQCLTNLVENALKYAPASTPVELGVQRHDDTVVLHVRDHGPGVVPGEREGIFELFRRGTAAPLASVSGSGIGLAMVRLLMERMGGTAQVADAPGGGADFQLLFPASVPALSTKPTLRTA